MNTQLAVQEAAGSVRQPGGVPMPGWKCEEGLRQLVALIERGDANSEIFFHVDFLRVLDAFLSQLIVWAEASSSKVKDWAGTALAERLRFLSTQEQWWSDGNEAFAATQKKFGDRRHARTPRSYLGWLAGDYLRILDFERLSAHLALDSQFVDKDVCVADLRGYSDERKERLRKLAALEEFSPKSAPMWAEMVYERMLVDENEILSAPEMRGRQSRDAKRRALSRQFAGAVHAKPSRNSQKTVNSLTKALTRDTGRNSMVRLSDYKQTITDAVIRLAEKPRGGVRGVTRP